MKAKDLRASILQLAVEGRLVEQRPEEGTAAELLEEVRAERRALVAAGKAKLPKGGESVIERGEDGSFYERRIDKRGRAGEPECIDDELPFEIPASWEWARLKDCCSATADCPHSTPAYTNAETGFYAIDTNCMDDSWHITGYRYLSENAYEQRVAAYAPKPGDVIFSREGSIGRSVILNQANVCLGQRVMVLSAEEQLLLNRYCQVVLTSGYAWNLYIAANVGTGVKHINVSMIRTLLVPLPPLAEQGRIVDKVDELMPLVEEYGRLEEARRELDAQLPEQLRKSVLQQAVEGRLVGQDPADEPACALLGRVREKRRALVAAGKAKLPKGGESVIERGEDGSFYECRIDKRGRVGEPACIDDELPFAIPASWEWARLGSVCEIVRGNGIKRSDITADGMPCIRYGELYTTYDFCVGSVKSRTSESIYGASRKLFPDEVVMTLTGENDIDIGRAIFNDTESTIAIGSDLLLLKGGYIDGAFASLSLNAPYMGKQRTDASTGNIIVHLGKDKVGDFLIAVPPLAEQKRIVAKVDELLALVSGLPA